MTSEKRCDNCEGPRTFCDVYDSYFCGPCDRWLEDRCSDTGCEFCSHRPDSPSRCEHSIAHHY